MMIRLSLAALALLAAAIEPVWAGDAAARRVIGFSPDGAYFAFEQYTMLYDDDAAFSEFVVVDTRTDRFAAGTPIRVFIRGDDGLDETKARAAAEKKATPLLEKFKISQAGTRIEGRPSMGLDEIGIYQMDPQPLAKSLDIALPDGRAARLSVTERPLKMAVCAGYGGRATAGKAMGHGLTLTLDVAGSPPLTLQQDKALPKARECAEAYGIAEAYWHKAPDGTLTLVALIEYADNKDYHAGPNRRFMAVTKRIPPR
jgi:predicted secreted protein